MIADRQEYSSISVKLNFKILHNFVADPPWSPDTIRATPRRTTTAPLSISTSLPLAWPRPRGRAVRERRSGAAIIRITTREDFPGLSLLKQFFSVLPHKCCHLRSGRRCTLAAAAGTHQTRCTPAPQRTVCVDPSSLETGSTPTQGFDNKPELNPDDYNVNSCRYSINHFHLPPSRRASSSSRYPPPPSVPTSALHHHEAVEAASGRATPVHSSAVHRPISCPPKPGYTQAARSATLPADRGSAISPGPGMHFNDFEGKKTDITCTVFVRGILTNQSF